MIPRLLIAGVCLLYVGLRIWRLADSCLWFDEIFSVNAAEHSWGTILQFISLDLIHPPLFYLVLKVWIAFGGDSVFWLRLLPVGFSIVALFPFLALCREIKLTLPTQVIALFLLAVNGSLIKYAQEVRMYSMLMCLSLFSMWLFARYFYRCKSFVPLVLVNMLLVYTHYFGWFVVASEVGLILWVRHVRWRRILLMALVVLVGFAPWAIAVLGAARSGSAIGQNIGWISRPGPLELSTFIFDLVEPIYFQASSSEPASFYGITLPILLLLLTTGTLFAVKHGAGLKSPVKLMVAFALLPVMGAFAASWLLPHSIWGTRHLIAVFGPLTIISAVTIAQWTRVSTFSTSLIFVLSGYALALSIVSPPPVYSWCRAVDMGRDLKNSGEGPIYTFEDLTAYQMWFEFRKGRGTKDWTEVVRLSAVDGVKEDSAYFLPRGFDGVQQINASDNDARQMWLVYRADAYNEFHPPLAYFRERGFVIAEQKTLQATDQKVIAVLVTKPDQAR